MHNKRENVTMSKATKEVVTEAQGKTVEELKEIAQTLQTQQQEHQRQANHHQTMATKAQGALEIMLQLIPKQEVEEMIEEEKANGEVENQEDNNK